MSNCIVPTYVCLILSGLLAHTFVCYHIQHNIYLKVVIITVDEHAYTRRNTSLYHVTDYARII